MAKKVKIILLNREYYIENVKSPLYISALVRYVENKMKEAGDRDEVVDTSRQAVHAALDIADEFFTLKEQQEKNTDLYNSKVDKIVMEIDKEVDFHT
jgi:cell division protein ZapA (FtsZ GTPase activity inhibitor)